MLTLLQNLTNHPSNHSSNHPSVYPSKQFSVYLLDFCYCYLYLSFVIFKFFCCCCFLLCNSARDFSSKLSILSGSLKIIKEIQEFILYMHMMSKSIYSYSQSVYEREKSLQLLSNIWKNFLLLYKRFDARCT